jgi:methylenetetrahydrofolate dehydrogenase (NADP+)/methenyltetrahydrofolate cyclohydrolase
MEMIIGRQIADEIKNRLKVRNQEENVAPCLAIINVGDDKENLIYIGLKEKAVNGMGGSTRILNLPATVGREEVLAVIKDLNDDRLVDGILLQLPLPEKLKTCQEEFLQAINPDKDVDGFNPLNRGRLIGDEPGFVSCAALACMDVSLRYMEPLQGKRVLLVGNSFDLIQPLAILFIKAGCELKVIPDYYPAAMTGIDIAVIEKGGPQIVKAEGIKPGSLIIDAGFYYDENNLYGNVDKSALEGIAGYHLPVPGGMGPILIAKLLENLCLAAGPAH